MSLYTQVKELQQKRKDILDGANAILTKVAKEKRSITAEEDTDFERRHTEGSDLAKQIDRLQKQHEAEMSLSAVRSDPRTAGREDTVRTAVGEEQRAEQVAALKAFMQFGSAGLTMEQRSEQQRQIASMPEGQVAAEVRALSTLTGPTGAYLIPTTIAPTIISAKKYFGGIIDAADYLDTDAGNDIVQPMMDDTFNTGVLELEGQLTGGTTDCCNPNSTDPLFKAVTFRGYIIGSGVQLLSISLAQDSAFDPEVWIQKNLETRIYRKMNWFATNGTGASQPTGILTDAPVGQTTSAPTTMSYLDFQALEHSVDPSYRPNSTFMFHDNTLFALQKLIDGNNRPLFLAGGVTGSIADKRPDTLDGYGFYINQDYPVAAAGAKTATFGDHKQFMIRRVRGMQMVRFGEKYMDRLMIGFMSWQRFDSHLLDPGAPGQPSGHPVMALQQAAS